MKELTEQVRRLTIIDNKQKGPQLNAITEKSFQEDEQSSQKIPQVNRIKMEKGEPSKVCNVSQPYNSKLSSVDIRYTNYWQYDSFAAYQGDEIRY